MSVLLMRLLNDDDGTTAIEYGLIAAGIAVAIIGAVNTLGTTVLTAQFQVIAAAVLAP